MGKFTDLVLGIIVLVIGIWFLTKLHLTAGQIWNMFWKFFSSSGSGTPTNATSGLILGMGMTNSRAREKLRNHIIAMKRRIAERTYRREEQEARRRFFRD